MVKLQIRVLKSLFLGPTTTEEQVSGVARPQWDLRDEHAYNMPISVGGSLDLLCIVPFKVLPQS